MLAIHELSFVNPCACTLSFLLAEEDLGILENPPGHLDCRLTREGYIQMLSLMEPFAQGSGGYAWLYDLDTPIELLLSLSGKW